MAISQKRLNFWMKRNCKTQGKMGCNGLGNRCSTEKAPEPKLRGITPAENERRIFGTGSDYQATRTWNLFGTFCGLKILAAHSRR
jgi:hypothetical protein